MQPLLTNAQQHNELMLSQVPTTQRLQKNWRLTRRKLRKEIGNTTAFWFWDQFSCQPSVWACLRRSHRTGWLWFPNGMSHLALTGEAQESFSHCPLTPTSNPAVPEVFRGCRMQPHNLNRVKEFYQTYSSAEEVWLLPCPSVLYKEG